MDEQIEKKINDYRLACIKEVLLNDDIEINDIISDECVRLAPYLTDMLRAFKADEKYTDQAYRICQMLERLLSAKAKELVESATEGEVEEAAQLTREENLREART